MGFDIVTVLSWLLDVILDKINFDTLYILLNRIVKSFHDLIIFNQSLNNIFIVTQSVHHINPDLESRLISEIFTEFQATHVAKSFSKFRCIV